MFVTIVKPGKTWPGCRSGRSFPESNRRNKLNISTLCGLLACLSVVFFNASHANGLKKIDLQTQAEKADIVVIASSGAEEVCSASDYIYPCVKLIDVNYIKGSRSGPDDVYLMLHTGIMEASVRNLKRGEVYIFFLRQFNGHFYSAVDGAYSVLKVEPNLK